MPTRHDSAPSEPTATQLRLVAFWCAFTDKNGYPPSYREACSAIGVSSTSAISALIERATARGLLHCAGGSRGRAVTVTSAGRAMCGSVSLDHSKITGTVVQETKCRCGLSLFIVGRVVCDSCRATKRLFISAAEIKCSSVSIPDAVEISITRGFKALVDATDYDLVSKYSWQVQITRGHVYAVARVGKQARVRMHRLILGAKRGELVDHVSNWGLDNRRANIRIATSAENSHNMCSSANQKRGGYKGVSLCRKTGRWRAGIRAPRASGASRAVTLGRFVHPQEAALAYDHAARTYYGRFAACNFPDES